MLEHLGASYESYMSRLSARQQVVSSNIANADTPGYKTRDVDFASELAFEMTGGKPAVIEVSGLRAKNDGNNVNLDREARLLAENALKFNIASKLAHGDLQMIKNAIDSGTSSSS
jgi:flagellar basal-body rod protein FlgB